MMHMKDLVQRMKAAEEKLGIARSAQEEKDSDIDYMI